MLAEASTFSTFIQLLVAHLMSLPDYDKATTSTIIAQAQAFRAQYVFRDVVITDDLMFELLGTYIDLSPNLPAFRSTDTLQRRIRSMSAIPNQLTKLLLKIEQQMGTLMHQYTNYPPIPEEFRDITLTEHIDTEHNTISIGRVVDDLQKIRDLLVAGHNHNQTKITKLLE